MNDQKFPKIIVILLFLIGLSFFSYEGFKNTETIIRFQLIYNLFYVFIAATIVKSYNYAQEDGLVSRNYVLLFTLLPFLTIITGYLTEGSPLYEGYKGLMMHMIVCIYFFLCYKNIDTSFIIKLLITCMLIKFSLTVIEQFTYPNAPFAMRMDTYDENNVFQELEVRSGFYRYLISDAYYLYMFVGFKSFVELTKEYSRNYLLLFVICCIGIYMDQTRQIMASFAACLFIVPMLSSSNSKKGYFVLIAIIGLILFNFYDVLFGEMSAKTGEEFNRENVRYLAYGAYFSDFDDILNILFGHGAETTIYTLDTFKQLQLYRVDIGIVGALHMLGIVFIVCFLLYYVNIVRKYWNSINMEYRMMLISFLFNIPLIFPLYNFTYVATECFLGMLLYMVDKSIAENGYLSEDDEQIYYD